MSVNKSKPKTESTSTQVSKPISLQDVEGITIVGNEGPINWTDGGAIQGSLGLAGSVVESAAELTLALVGSNATANREALDFAMSAGRSDVAAVQDSNKIILYVVAIAAAAFVLHQWAK